MPAESSAAPESDVVAPATTFAALGVPAPLVEVLDDQGITAPFPVQAATLPDGLAGRVVPPASVCGQLGSDVDLRKRRSLSVHRIGFHGHRFA